MVDLATVTNYVTRLFLDEVEERGDGYCNLCCRFIVVQSTKSTLEIAVVYVTRRYSGCRLAFALIEFERPQLLLQKH